MKRGNLYAGLDTPPAGECFESVFQSGNVTIERIVSAEDNPPVDYLQNHDEWVLVLRGSADLRVNGVMHHLKPGDWIELPAGTPHRVEATEHDTLWLAVHAR